MDAVPAQLCSLTNRNALRIGIETKWVIAMQHAFGAGRVRAKPMEATVAASKRFTKISNRTTRLRKFWCAIGSGAVVLVFLQHSHYTLAKWKMENSMNATGDTRSTTDRQALMWFRIGAKLGVE